MAERAVYKSTAAEFLDAMFGGTPEELEAAYESSLELIEATSDGRLSEAAARLVDDGGLPPAAVEDSESGWRASAEVDRVLRAGYREAIRLARDRELPVPIDTLWVTGAADEFEIHVCETDTRVTILLFIPLTRSYGSANARSRSWVVRAGGPDDAEESMLEDGGDPPLVMVQQSGRGVEESAS